jgi:hypothetical protein
MIFLNHRLIHSGVTKKKNLVKCILAVKLPLKNHQGLKISHCFYSALLHFSNKIEVVEINSTSQYIILLEHIINRAQRYCDRLRLH